MKKIAVILFISCYFIPASGRAQILSEWLNQKKTQIKYLVTQIAELQVYLGYVKRGYKIVSSGLNTVKDIKNGEFSLHDLYYTSLGTVNPRIRNSPKTMSIIGHQQYILKATSAVKQLLPSENQLSPAQKKYIVECIDRLLDDLEKVSQELIDITTDKTVEMSDDERLLRLGKLYSRSQSQFVFTQQFCSEILAMVKSIRQELRDEQALKNLHGLP